PTTVRQGYVGQRDQRNLDFSFGHDHHVVSHEHGAAAQLTVRQNHRIVAANGKEYDRRAASAGHGCHERVVGLEHCRAVVRHGLDDRSLDGGQLLDRFDVADTQVVAFADVCDHRDVATIETQPCAQDAAAGRFQHGNVNHGI